MTLTKIRALCGAVPAGIGRPARITTKEDAAWIAAARELLPKLLDVAEWASRVHHYDDSPRPEAQLRFDEAIFEMASALQRLEAAP